GFLVDTGSEISVLPAARFEHLDKSAIQLFAANGSTIRTCGQKLVKLDLNLRRDFSRSFIIADFTTAIIGADFLKAFHLVPDLTCRRLVDMTTKLAITCQSAPAASLGLGTIDSDD